MKRLITRIAERTGLKRRHLEGARMLLERGARAVIASPRKRRQGRILCYHSVGQPAFGVNDVTPTLFRRQITLALRYGYRFVRAVDIANGQSGPRDLALTFDDGFKTVLTEATPILREFSIPYTVFVVSEWPELREPWQQTSLMSWADIENLCAAGVDIGSHSATHCDFGNVNCRRMYSELIDSRETIRQRLGITPDLFAIPLGLSKNWTSSAQEAIHAVGYCAALAQAEETRPAGTVPRSFVSRFDGSRNFEALLNGAYDDWEEWVCSWGC